MTCSPGLAARVVAAFALVPASISGGKACAGEGYLGLHVGTHFWPAYSNRDQVEADTTPGYSYGIVGGLELGGDDLRGGAVDR
ncbi:MAG: hypothetical protein AAGC67_19500, partial [Myxococcota bacterium]